MKIKIPKLSLKNLKELFSFNKKRKNVIIENEAELIKESVALEKLREFQSKISKISETMEVPKEYMGYPEPSSLKEIEENYKRLKERVHNQEEWGKLYYDEDKRFFDY